MVRVRPNGVEGRSRDVRSGSASTELCAERDAGSSAAATGANPARSPGAKNGFSCTSPGVGVYWYGYPGSSSSCLRAKAGCSASGGAGVR